MNYNLIYKRDIILIDHKINFMKFCNMHIFYTIFEKKEL